ncbi:MAG: hypothetical protein HKN81_09575 [Gammaproteobacteria bacterium]|nr:hypothetical protein [Gammaproteobacteria bacterium]
MNQDKDDKALEDYLDGGSAESKRYAELGDELPPPELDAKILAQAEREVKVTGIDSRRAPPFKAFAWAAVFVVSFSLVLNIVFEQAVQDPVAELEGMANRSAEPVPSAEPFPSVRRGEEILATAKKAERPPASAAPSEKPAPVRSAGRVMPEQESVDAAEEHMDLRHAEADEVEQSRVRQDAPSVAAAAPEPADTAGLGTSGGQAKGQQTVAATMQTVADYLALPAGAGREQALLRSMSVADDDASALKEVLDLYEAGREREALEALAEFRSEYPDHPVSVELEERGL